MSAKNNRGWGNGFYDPGRRETVSKRGQTKGICISCGSSVFVTRAGWFRKTRPVCGCGGLLEPSHSAHKKLFGS